MKKPRPNHKRLQQKRAKKAAKRKKTRAIALAKMQRTYERMRNMDENQLRELLGDEYEELMDDECENHQVHNYEEPRGPSEE